MADNKNIQKIFSLGDIRKKQLLGEVPQRTRETYREFLYYSMGGPFGSPGFTQVYRLDYSNDTNVLNSHTFLTTQHTRAGASGNSNFGYFGGGNSTSRVDRIDYSNDSATASVRGPLSSARGRLAATGNSNFGYFGGGYVGGPTVNISIVDRVNYSNDLSTSSVRGPLSFARQSVGAAFSSKSHGYFSGGALVLYFVPAFSTIDRIDYANDSITASIRGPLSSARRYAAGTGNANFGYSFGGRNLPNNAISLVDRISYANDTATSVPRGGLVQARTNPGASGNSNFAYVIGGFSSIIDRVDYSNDTIISERRANLNASLYGGQATSSSSFGGSPNSSFASDFTFPTVPNAGYFGGGYDGTNNFATIDKVDYANDTSTASVRSALSSAKYSLAAIGNGSFGYFGGGSPGPLSSIERLEYSSDTQNTSTRTNLQIALTQSTAVGNESFGYFSGENAQIQKIDYSNDSTSIVGNIDDARQLNASTSTRNFGYFSAGDIPEVSIIQRINFSNDTANALFRTNHAFNRRQHGGVGNETYGYFGGGVIAGGFSTLVERLDYSNDTTQPNIRGPLSLPRRAYLGATGSQNFGYFSGGDVPGPTYFSTTDRINYSNDTAVASIRGSLSTAKGSGAATSPLGYGGAPIYFTNPLPEVLQKQIEFDDSNTLDLPFKRVLGSYGYWVGGLPNFSSIVSRLDFSNDTANAIQRGPLSNGLYRAGGCGNANFGYFGGGVLTGNFNRSTVDRIDYSNDISIASRRTTITARQGLSGVGNNNFGFFGGSFYQNIFSLIERIDYSNDTSIGIRKGQLSSNRGLMAATGNSNFGYFGGGALTGNPNRTTVDRIDYSNDTPTASVRGPLSSGRSGLAATGNSNFGYFGGGSPGPVSTVDRIDYSNDTETASVRGSLSSTQSENIATGNSNFGYFSMGSVSRINYSNDTATGLPRGNTLTYGRQTATTNARSS